MIPDSLPARLHVIRGVVWLARLTSPLYYFEILDNMFLVKCILTTLIYTNLLVFNSPGNCSNSVKQCGILTVIQQLLVFYYNSIVKLWNSLPPIDLIESIKQHLYSHLHGHFHKNFSSDNLCTFHYLCQCSSCVFVTCLQIYYYFFNSTNIFGTVITCIT